MARDLTPHVATSAVTGPAPTPTTLLDPTDLGPLPQIPLIPEAIRRQHQVLVDTDNRFKQAARFLQALWREDHDLAIGGYVDAHGKTRKLGSAISTKAGNLGGNFIDPELLPVVNRALIYREVGAVYDLQRLKTNLLSSQPLVFNTFGHLQRDLTLASRFVAELLPGLLDQVTDILFEHSPGRGDPRFTGDGTAFDLAIRGRTPTGQRALIAIEVKYSEACHDTLPRFTGRFDQIAPTTQLFRNPEDPALKTNPCQQLFRQHTLAATILDQGLADIATLAFIAPAHNHLAQGAASTYAAQLLDPTDGRIPFRAVTLEQVFAALAAAGLPEHARALHRRYTDWWLVDGELQLGDPSADAATPVVTTGPHPTRRPAKAA